MGMVERVSPRSKLPHGTWGESRYWVSPHYQWHALMVSVREMQSLYSYNVQMDKNVFVRILIQGVNVLDGKVPEWS